MRKLILNKFIRTKNREQNMLDKIVRAQWRKLIRFNTEGYLTTEQVARKRSNPIDQ